MSHRRRLEPDPPVGSRMVTIVAHRAGNRPDTAQRASVRGDVIELDVHVFGGRAEVRHTKVLRPSSRLWEQWRLLPIGTSVPALDEILEAVGREAPLMLDLKCFTPRAARRIRAIVPETQPLIVSSRSWWVLRAFRTRPDTPLLRSCGNRLQLRLALVVPGMGGRVGIGAHESLLDDRAIKATRDQTPLLFSWGVESARRGTALVEAGVTGLIVDDPELSWPR